MLKKHGKTKKFPVNAEKLAEFKQAKFKKIQKKKVNKRRK